MDLEDIVADLKSNPNEPLQLLAAQTIKPKLVLGREKSVSNSEFEKKESIVCSELHSSFEDKVISN